MYTVGHLSTTTGAVKTLTILLRECTYSATGNSRVQYLNSPANCILVGHGLYTQFTRPFLSCGSGSGLQDYWRSCCSTLNCLYCLLFTELPGGLVCQFSTSKFISFLFCYLRRQLCERECHQQQQSGTAICLET